MSNTVEPTVAAENPTAEAFEQPPMPGTLRALIRRRTETKIRRIHKQWFCLDPEVQAELEAAQARLAELVGLEVLKQSAKNNPTNRKYALPTPVVEAERQVADLKARSLAVGVMGVFQNLDDDQLTAIEAAEPGFEKARKVLLDAWLRWEDADGNQLPDDVLGREDLDALLQPEVLERGEWLPLAAKIVRESNTPIDRPTSQPA